MSVLILKKYKPSIVGITGSVGKTSAKEATFLALSSKFRVRKNEKNYNNEIGIPLTILGAESGNRSIGKWIGVFWKGISLILFPHKYPEILVLEMGVDRPGDMKYLTSFIPLKVAVITNISTSHIEFFKNIEHIAKEKGKIIENLPQDGTAILNADDERVMARRGKTKAKVLTFGFAKSAQLKATEVSLAYKEDINEGINFKLDYKGKIIPVRLRHIYALHQIYAALVAASVGIIYKVNLIDISGALENFFPPAGRMNLIEGINDCYIFDDTYNASPVSTVAALEMVSEFPCQRKIAVLGDMLELGKAMEDGYEKVAKAIVDLKIDLFFGVGERMEVIVKELMDLGYPAKNISYFENPDLAVVQLEKELQSGDLVLVKGSQGMRMEKIVEKIMARPDKAGELLCRQNKEWKKIPFVKP
jgi:UDP-N-acetylmuramoyl-tripeptide--D-alanyl-D-alanine ligase